MLAPVGSTGGPKADWDRVGAGRRGGRPSGRLAKAKQQPTARSTINISITKISTNKKVTAATTPVAVLCCSTRPSPPSARRPSPCPPRDRRPPPLRPSTRPCRSPFATASKTCPFARTRRWMRRRNVRHSPVACAFTHSPSHGASKTRRKQRVEEENARGGRSGRPSRTKGGAQQQWARLLLQDGRAIGYVLAPVGDECRRGGGRRRPFDLVRVTILDEMTERDQEDSSD